MGLNDDDLEADLRRVLADPAHRLPDTLVPLERVHAGARRRKARRQAMVAVAGASAGVLAVVAFVGVNHLTHGAGTVAAGVSNRTPLTPTSPALSLAMSDTASATPTTSLPRPLATPATAVPDDFAPVSVTAIRPKTWWVLGQAGELIATTDGGSTFSFVSDSKTSGLPTSAGEVRFADAQNGWAVSTPDSASTHSLWRTSDGGKKWTPISLTGTVGTIELGGGEAYALVRTGANTWWVFQAASNGSTGWQSLGSLGSVTAQPLLAVQSGRAVVAATTAGTIRTWVFAKGGHASSAKPCDASLGATDISATVKGVWLACATGTADGLWQSPDGGTWASVSSGGPSASRLVVGAIDGTHAAVGHGDGNIYVVGLDGSNRKATGPFSSSDQWQYIAFTNSADGFAIDLSGRMLRTTNGGMSWTRITFH